MTSHRSAVVAAVVVVACWLVPAASAETVKITRDSYGEPHISASSAPGAMYGFAYAQMQDQATAVLGGIYTATGRSAEVEGESCLAGSIDACFQSDQLAHLLRVPEVADRKFEKLPAADRRKFRGFARGINSYVKDNPASVPAWAVGETVSASDVLASAQWRFVLAQFKRAGLAFRGFDPGPAAEFARQPTTLGAGMADAERSFVDVISDPSLGVQTAGASNMFVVGGSKTQNGKPLLQDNPHLPFGGLTQWYQAQLTYPGVNVAGATFRGLPVIGVGSNGDVAWGFTANQGAVHEQDAYKETLDPADPDRYMYDGRSKAMTVRTVEIKAETSPGTIETIPVRFRYTIHGPVVTDPTADLSGNQPAPGATAAGSVTASLYEQVGLASTAWRMTEANNIGEWKRALADPQLSQYNMVAADSAGNIFYVAESRSGVLNPGVGITNILHPTAGVVVFRALDGSVPNNTWVSNDPDRPWTGVIPFDELPQAQNPPSGFYQDGNVPPWVTAPGQISIDDVPEYMRLGADGTRSRRQHELLAPAHDMTLADADAIGFDSHIEFAPALIDLLDQAAALPGADPKVQEAASVLDGWNYDAGPESTQFVLFTAWVRALNPQQLGFAPQQASAPFPEGLVGQPGGPTAGQLAEAARAMGASGMAYDEMIEAYGSLTKRTGDVNRMVWGAFDGGVGGGNLDAPSLWMADCRGAYPPTVLVAFPCQVTTGSGYVMNVDLGSGKMHTSIAASASDDPASPFYTANVEDWSAKRIRNYPRSSRALAAEKTSELELKYRSESRPKARLAVIRIAEHVRRGWVELQVDCKVASMTRCIGKLLLEHQGRMVAHRRYAVRDGASTLRLRLDRKARKQIRHHELRVVLSWTTDQKAGAATEDRKSATIRCAPRS